MRIKHQVIFLLILPILCLSQSVLANGNDKMNCQNDQVISCFSDTYIHDGIYFGFGTGYDSYRISHDGAVIDVNRHFIRANPPFGARGYLANLLFGYDRLFDWFYIGIEAFAKYTNAGTTFSINAYNTDFSVQSNYGFSLLSGIKLTEMAVIYGRIGYVKTSMNSSENGLLLRNLDERQWANGLDFGVGIETAVFNKLSIRGEYIYTNYRSIETAINTHFNPSNTQFNLNLIYHWC